MSKREKKAEQKTRPTPRKNRLSGPMQNTWVQAAVVLAMGCLLALVIVMQPGSDRPPPDLDVVVGETADHDIRATHNFAIVQIDTTGLDERRIAAAALVLPVWEFDEDIAGQVDSRVEVLFLRMRRELKGYAETLLTSRALEGSGTAAEPVLPDDPIAELTDADLALFVSDRLDTINAQLGTRLDTGQLLPIARTGFASEVERPLREVVSDVLARPLVRSVSAITEAGASGVLLVRLRDERPVSPPEVSDVRRFRDPEAAHPQIASRLDDRFPGTAMLRDSVMAVAGALVQVNINTYFNRGETRARQRVARAAVEAPSRTLQVTEGTVIVARGEVVTDEHLQTLQTMAEVTPKPPTMRANEVVIGGIIYVLIVLLGVMTYGMRFIRRFAPSIRDLACMTVVLVLMVAMTRGVLLLGALMSDRFVDFPIEAIFAAIPFAAGAMLIRVVLNAESAMIFAITYSLLVALMMPEYPVFAAYALVGSLAGTGAVEVVRTRMSLFRGGLLVGLVNIAFGLAITLLSSSFASISSLQIAGFALIGGVLVAILVTALLPVVETVFHYISDFKLLELANPDHPALRHLLLHAPGSYHHSMMVASLVESACKSVGANPLLGRVGSYYHDIGKARNPGYFAENQKGKNPHDKLKPHMSALVIKAHVKDGVDMAIQHGLPEEIIRFIQEHHGTSRIEFFFRRAKDQEDPDIQGVDEKDFRYPGPKPQTPETAICMLADGIEAASRAMQEPNPARLQGLVQKMVNRAFTDGQLDECDLTLRDLHAIARSFIRILLSIYHQRPEYPGARKDTGQKLKSQAAPRQSSSQDGAQEGPENGSGDADSADSGETAAANQPVEPEGPATLRRLGID